MKIIIYTALVMGIFLIGCVSNTGTLKIQGKVIDEFTKEPIPFRELVVQGLVLQNNSLVPIEVGNFSTDSTGYFKYPLRKIKYANSYNFCLVGDSDYSFKAETIDLRYLERNGKQLSFSLSKLARLTILIFRRSKTPVCDTLFLSWRSDGVNGRSLFPYKINNYGLPSTLGLKWIGGNVKSTVKTRTLADQRTTVRWVLFRNGKRKEIIDTITCKRDLENKVFLRY